MPPKKLGDSGADLYKVEMPLYGKGPQQELLCASQRLNDHINMPWVILSSGVDEKLFPRAVRVAMTAGASGFWQAVQSGHRSSVYQTTS